MDKSAIDAVILLRDCVREMASLVKEASLFLEGLEERPGNLDAEETTGNSTKYINFTELQELVDKI